MRPQGVNGSPFLHFGSGVRLPGVACLARNRSGQATSKCGDCEDDLGGSGKEGGGEEAESL
jgi:hypothetical protein